MERHKETLKAIAFILLILGTLAFTEWVVLKDYEPTPNSGWSRGEKRGVKWCKVEQQGNIWMALDW